MPPPFVAHASFVRQRGISLFTVLVMIVLGLLLVLGSSKLTLLNERLSGNNSDYQRAYEAAEAMIADARLDIACLNATCTTRDGATKLTCDLPGFYDLQATLKAQTTPCKDGICVDLGAKVEGNPATSFWNVPAAWALFKPVGAKYGTYTNSSSAGAVNPLLADRAWYWIEVLPYSNGYAGASNFLGGQALKPDKNCPFVFRITAVAEGWRPGTKAVLQTLHLFRSSTGGASASAGGASSVQALPAATQIPHEAIQ